MPVSERLGYTRADPQAVPTEDAQADGAPAEGVRGEPAAGQDGASLAVLAEVMRRVDLDALALSMVDAYREQIEAYSRLPEGILYGRKLALARSNLDLFKRLSDERRGITDADIDERREAARQDVRDGIALEAVLRAYQIGGALAWRTIADAAEPHEHARGLLAATHLYVSFSEQVSAAICEVYAVELERCDAGRNRVARSALRALLGSAAPDELARRARAAGLVVGRVYTPFVARGGDDADLELVRSLRAAGVFVVQEAGAVVGFVQTAGDERALAQCGAAFALATDTPRERLGDALKALRQLVDVAVRLGLRRRVGEREFLLERSLANSPVLDDTLERLVVTPLVEHDTEHGSELIRTLRAFVDSGLRRKGAAQALHIHPNTLDSRLARIAALAGLDLALPQDLAQVIVAISRPEVGGEPL